MKPIQRPNLTEEIVKSLVDFILDEGLKPGDKLPSERELIEHFGVGRSSLREALKILAAIGVMEVSAGEGMFVGRGDLSLITKPLSLGLFMGEGSRAELIETRRILEVELAGLAAERATDEEIAAIGARLEAMRVLQERPAEYSQADLDFHLEIARAAHNGLLFNLLHTLRDIMRALITTVVRDHDSQQMPQSYSVHVPIFEAIRARDAQAARRAMLDHLDRLEERVSEAISREGQGPEAALAHG